MLARSGRTLVCPEQELGCLGRSRLRWCTMHVRKRSYPKGVFLTYSVFFLYVSKIEAIQKVRSWSPIYAKIEAPIGGSEPVACDNIKAFERYDPALLHESKIEE